MARALLKRVRRLVAAKASEPAPESVPSVKTDEEWWELLEKLGKEGIFRNEPDFPRALQFYHDAIEAAKSPGSNKLFEPPPAIQPELPLRERRYRWRQPERFPSVNEGFFWAIGFLQRHLADEPPVTEAEFNELSTWFRANESRLKAAMQTSESRTLYATTRYHVEKGFARSWTDDKTIKSLRDLKAKVGASVA